MKLTWQVIVLGIASLVLGAWLNDIVYKRNNEKLLAQLKAELLASNYAKQSATGLERVAIDNKQQRLVGQIALLEQQLA